MPADLDEPADDDARSGSDELHDYLEWLKDVWLPNVGRGLKFPERPKEPPHLTLIEGDRPDAS